MRNYIREPINSLTHLIGAILSLLALIAMITKVCVSGKTSIELTAVIIFGISMILLYATSATYHMVISSDHVLNFLQRLDHSMIISTTIYIVMGWLAIFVFKPLLLSLGTNGLFLLIFGGLLYTVGGVIYALKPKSLSFKHWGFHEIFHLFIMMGSLYHFLCIYLYVL